MSDEKIIEKLEEGTLEGVSGGMSGELSAAYACLNGSLGSGDEQAARLRRAGYDPNVVLGLAADLQQYEQVARDVIRGNYGKGNARVKNLEAAGYPAATVQNLVNHMSWDPVKKEYIW